MKSEAQFLREFDEREADAACCNGKDSGFERGWMACEEKVKLALGGHKNSELWGECGLLAATMRLVNSVQDKD